MRREVVKGRRVRDGKEVEVVELLPETLEDVKEIERLDREGLISQGDTFAEQLEHKRQRRKRREGA